MPQKPLTEVSFGSVSIQQLRRVSLDQNLLRTLGLNIGDNLDVVLMVETGEIVLRKHQHPSAKRNKKSG